MLVNRESVARGINVRPDFIGARRDEKTDGLIFTCACGCGGHALVDRAPFENMEAYRADFSERMKRADMLPAFAGTVYVEGHEPFGIAGQKIRCGKRVHLRAST